MECLLWLCLISGIADGAVLLLEQYSVSFAWSFDAYPGNQITTIYRILLVLVSAAVWLYADRKPASQKRETGSPIRKELAPENGH